MIKELLQRTRPGNFLICASSFHSILAITLKRPYPTTNFASFYGTTPAGALREHNDFGTVWRQLLPGRLAAVVHAQALQTSVSAGSGSVSLRSLAMPPDVLASAAALLANIFLRSGLAGSSVTVSCHRLSTFGKMPPTLKG